MEAERRMLSTAELEVIWDRLQELVDTEGSTIVKRCGSVELAVRRLAALSVSQRVVIFYDKGLFIGITIFDVISEWWSNSKFLVEHLVLCVDPDYKGFARVAIDELERLGKEFGVEAIVAGCAFNKNSQLVTNSYKKKGFTIVCPNYIKMLKG